MRAALLSVSALLLASALPAAPAQAATFRFFDSPSGNIDCVVSNDEARCDIRQHTFKAPKRPRSCDLEWGSTIAVSKASTRGAFACVGDTARDPNAKALAFGKTVRVATMRCTSRMDGVRCANGKGHGFLIGRAAYRLF